MSTGREWDWEEDGSNVKPQIRLYNTEGYKVYMCDRMAQGLREIGREVELELMLPQKEWWEPLKEFSYGSKI